MQKNIGSKLALYPMPLLVIGTMVDGKVNWLLAGHSGIIGHDRVMVSLVKTHYTNIGIKDTKTLSINLVSEEMLKKADYVGSISGKKQDKSDVFEYHIGEAGAPIINNSPVVMECKVEDNYETNNFDNFIMSISNTYVQEENLWVNYVLNSPIVSRPGTTFNYFTGNTHLLSAIIQKATGKTTYDFGKEYLFDPLGMDSVTCDTDAQGISDGGNGFALNPYDMAKFGQLFLNNGVWEGEQIISEQWVKDSTSMQFNRSSGSADYGYQWWVRTFGDNAHPGYFSQGHYGQYIFVVPDLNLVVAIT